MNWREAWLASADDPFLFATEVIGVDPEPWQTEALKAIGKHNRVSIRSGHGVGKTAYLSWVALWFMLTRTPVKIGVIANSQDQLRDVVWPEIALWLHDMPEELSGRIEKQAERFSLKDNPEYNYMVARTASHDRPEALQGLHSENMLFLMEEASGIEDKVFELGLGVLSTPDAKMLMVGNPTRGSGFFYKTHHALRDKWYTMRVNSEDVVRARGHIDDVAAAYGEESNVYRVRVLGEFPRSGDNTVIPLEWIEEAVHREVEPVAGDVMWGLDVARFGTDRTALVKRCRNHVLEKAKVWRNKDLMQTAGLVKLEYENTPSEEQPSSILVDSIGYGAGVVDRLREEGLPARGVNVAEMSTVKEEYQRLRDELWFRARGWFEEKDCLAVDDPVLAAELSTVQYAVNSAGKIKVESKDDMRRRGLRSPDLADAFCLTFAHGGARNFMKPIDYPTGHFSNNLI